MRPRTKDVPFDTRSRSINDLPHRDHVGRDIGAAAGRYDIEDEEYAAYDPEQTRARHSKETSQQRAQELGGIDREARSEDRVVVTHVCLPLAITTARA